MQDAVRKIIHITLSLLLCALLAGCTNVAISGAQAVYNHKNIENSVTDTVIALKANHVINHPRFKDTNISIAVLNKEILLSGEVNEPWQKTKVTELMSKIAGVEHVYNYLAISAPSSSLSQAADSWVTTKVKSKIIASRDLDATRIKIVTERGTVYIMGIMTPDEAEDAKYLAQTTDGVTSVVSLVSYMKITKTL